MKKSEFYVIQGMRMAEALIRKGVNIHKVEDARDNPYFKVFIFKNTPKFQQAMKEVNEEWEERKISSN